MFKKRGIVLFALMLGGLAGCFRPVIPISTRPQYPIDVFYEHETVSRPYDEVRLLSLSEEKPLDARQRRSRDRMLYRGNDLEQKDLLLAQMVVDAQRLGADALVNVKYQVFTSATTTGYTLEGLAVKYRGE
jgi:hypothetical protein